MVLEVSIKKNLRDFVLNVTFQVQDEVFALLGASGCGKSMTLKTIAGIETPDEGKIILNGRILFDSDKKINLPPQARRVGYLFQNYALFPNMTVAENILFAAVGSQSEKIQKLRENLARFELNGLENSYPGELSGGQQQRVAFARILSSHAEILLLDEPFSALDNFLKWRLELELEEIFQSYGGAAILVSHDRGEVFRLSDKIAVMSQGKISEANTKQEIFKNPKTVAAATLTGCKNISAAKKIDANKIFATDWNITLTLNKKIPDDLKFVGIHSNFLENATAGENVFPFEVAKEIEDTFFYIVMLRAGKNLIRWEVQKNLWQKIKAAEISINFPAEKIILMNG
ncbi:MAG: ATP-binding cassette domain-containing protein [Selenomonadaceae bacterium]|nr:ATP-binding cassette domain-containing protein [Selenomonadaceae bacterium]